MRGLFIEDGEVSLRDDLPSLDPTAEETRVRVLRAGVCATDLALKAGYMGFTGVPGHEFVGRAVDGPLAGKRVVGEINAACGACDWCRAGDDRHCPSRTVLGILQRSGAFAEELVLPSRNLLEVPPEVSDDAATFTEPLAAALQIPAQVDVDGARALVVGDGRLGILCAHALARGGAEVTVSGRHPERGPLLPPGVAQVSAVGSGERGLAPRSFDVVVEATGRGEILEQVVSLVRPLGTLVLKTTAERQVPLNLWEVVVNEITVVGSRCGRFAPALEALASGAVPVEGMVDARFGLDAGAAALERAAAAGVLKVLIDIDDAAAT